MFGITYLEEWFIWNIQENDLYPKFVKWLVYHVYSVGNGLFLFYICGNIRQPTFSGWGWFYAVLGRIGCVPYLGGCFIFHIREKSQIWGNGLSHIWGYVFVLGIVFEDCSCCRVYCVFVRYTCTVQYSATTFKSNPTLPNCQQQYHSLYKLHGANPYRVVKPRKYRVRGFFHCS
jgi:hypothetical protein